MGDYSGRGAAMAPVRSCLDMQGINRHYCLPICFFVSDVVAIAIILYIERFKDSCTKTVSPKTGELVNPCANIQMLLWMWIGISFAGSLLALLHECCTHEGHYAMLRTQAAAQAGANMPVPWGCEPWQPGMEGGAFPMQPGMPRGLQPGVQLVIQPGGFPLQQGVQQGAPMFWQQPAGSAPGGFRY